MSDRHIMYGKKTRFSYTLKSNKKTRQRESFLILMNNMKKAHELTAIAAESHGMAELKYQAYLSSSEAATKRLQNAWEGLTNSFKTSNFLAGVKKSLAWLVENLTKVASLVGTIFAAVRTTRGMNTIFKSGFGNFMSNRFGGRIANAYGVANRYVQGEQIPNILQKFDGYLRSITTNVAEIKVQKSGATTQTAATGVTPAGPGSGKLGLSEGTLNGNRIVRDISSGRLYYAPTGRKGRKILSKEDTVAMLNQQGFVTSKTLGGRTFARGQDGNWYKVTKGGISSTPMRFTGRNGINAANLDYLNAQADMKRTTFTVEGNKKLTTATRGEDGVWRYSNNRQVAAKKAEKLEQQYQDVQAKAGLLKKQYQQSRRQQKAAGVAAGIAAGITSGLTTGLNFKNSDGGEASGKAKAVVGVTTGLATAVSTGLISAIPYVGPILGPTLGPLIGQAFGTYIAPLLGNLIDQQTIARRERSKDAEKTYNTLKSINNDTEKLRSLSQKGSWSYEDYQQAATTVDGIIKQMFGNSKAARALAPSLLSGVETSGLSDAALVEKLAEKFRSEYLSVNATEKTRQNLINAWEQALAKEMADQYEASQEANIYKYNETLHNPTVKGTGAKSAVKRFASETGAGIIVSGNRVTFTDTKIEDRLLTEQKLLNYLQDQGEETSGFYKALQKSIADLNSTIGELTDMTESINKERLNAAVISSKVLNYSTAQIKERGIDAITKEVLDALNNMENGGLYISSSNTNYKAQWNGSYSNLGETAKNYLTDYFRGNSKLLGLLTQESYTLKDVLVKGLLGDLDSTEALTFLTKFSKGLGTTVDKLESYIDQYGDFTLGDLLLGDSDIFSKIESLNEILNNIVSATGLTAQNTMDIISKYPQYIKYLGDISLLTKAIASDVKSWIQLQTQGFAQAINESTTIYDNIFDKIKKNFKDTDFYSWFIKGENFGEINNLGNFYDKYFTLSEGDKEIYASQFKEIDDMISEEYGSFQTNFTTKYIDIAKDYYSKLYEMQISNLESQKSALENINSQREYENKLVEARLKLENAQNEKQMVYREGVGFIYEADQEAVQEAQEELDQLETEKLTDMLQMQIDELQSQKKWFDEYAERNQFKAMAEAVEGLTKDGGPLDSLNSTGQDLKAAADNILEAYKKVNQVSLEDLKETAGQKTEDEKDLVSQQLLESGKSVISNRKKLNLAQKAVKGDPTALGALLDSDTQFKSNYEKAETPTEKQKVLANYLQATKDNYNTAYSTFQSSYTNAEQLGVDLDSFVLDKGLMASGMKKEMGEGGEYAAEPTIPKPNIPAGLVDLALEEANEGMVNKLKNSGWNKRVYIAYTNLNGEEYHYMVGLDTEDEKEAQSIIKRMLGTRLPSETLEKIVKTDYLSNTSGGSSRGDDLIREYFNNDFGYNVNPNRLKEKSRLIGTTFYDNASQAGSGHGKMWYNRILFDDADDGDLHASDVVSIKQLQDYISELMRYDGDDGAGLFPKDRNARGSLYTRAGLSAISELGPELFATPGLSGTALIPEGSKVLPADATKGLWEFGSFASEFIKPLRSLMSGFGNGDAVGFGTDESTNINTLNITLRADKDFDADKFIQQLKLLQAISKNNA